MAADLPTLIRSHARWRLGFLGLALGVPLLLGTLFQRQIHRLEALADHGREATATVTSVARDGSTELTRYAYSVGGVSYTWNVSWADAPYQPGDSFPVTYLPEDPSLSRPGAPPSSHAKAEAEGNAAFVHKALIGVFAFFAFNAVLCHLKLRKLRANAAAGLPAAGLVVPPAWLGRGVAVLLLGALLSVSFDPKVQAVQAKAFGATPLGMPITAFACLATVVLFAPYVWVFEHAMRIALQALEDGASVSKVGLLVYLFSLGERHPELVRSRNVVLGGLGFFGVLMGLWIAYAAALGI